MNVGSSSGSAGRKPSLHMTLRFGLHYGSWLETIDGQTAGPNRKEIRCRGRIEQRNGRIDRTLQPAPKGLLHLVPPS